jgi:hypothetical protein
VRESYVVRNGQVNESKGVVGVAPSRQLQHTLFSKVAFLLLGAALWLQMEPSRELFPEVLLAEGAASRLV